jgi:hypothetical protein
LDYKDNTLDGINATSQSQMAISFERNLRQKLALIAEQVVLQLDLFAATHFPT